MMSLSSSVPLSIPIVAALLARVFPIETRCPRCTDHHPSSKKGMPASPRGGPVGEPRDTAARSIEMGRRHIIRSNAQLGGRVWAKGKGWPGHNCPGREVSVEGLSDGIEIVEYEGRGFRPIASAYFDVDVGNVALHSA